MRGWLAVAAVCLALAGPGAVRAAEAQGTTAAGARKAPDVGDLAPAFTLPGSDGQMHSLSDHLGRRPVVIAWFPRVFATR
jgi:peroxiredoxin